MVKITQIKAKQVLDSRGNPTIEVLAIAKNKCGHAMVPSGASTGIHEALELRDKGKKYLGKGVLKAVNNVNNIIARKLKGLDPSKQEMIDDLMIRLDGTKNKSRLGANAILGVSLAVARLGACSKKRWEYEHIAKLSKTKKIMLPVPFMNIINGGKHAQNNLAFQEFMIAPLGKTFSESLRMGSEVYHELKKIIAKKYGKTSTNVGDEGGFAPNVKNVEEPPELILEAAEELGYEKKIKLAIDAAASEFYSSKGYLLDGHYIETEELLEIYEDLAGKYPMISIEDPFDQEEFNSFSLITTLLGKKVQIVGDDLLVTNVERINKALKFKACNALLLKVNQIGTLTEALEAAKAAFKNKWKVMVSHRSGETEDPFIADLAVGLGTGQIKAGAPCRGERTAKYNQLLRIEEYLGKKAVYGGRFFRR